MQHWAFAGGMCREDLALASPGVQSFWLRTGSCSGGPQPHVGSA